MNKLCLPFKLILGLAITSIIIANAHPARGQEDSAKSTVRPQALEEKEDLDEKLLAEVQHPGEIRKEPIEKKEIETHSEKREDEIPVLQAKVEKKKVSAFTFERILVTLGLLGTLIGLLVYFVRSRRHFDLGKKSGTVKIRVISSQMLTPKNSVCVINVASEYFLVGVTEQKISILKTLSILEEDVSREPAPEHRSFRHLMSPRAEDEFEDTYS